MPHTKEAAINSQINTDEDDDDRPRIMISVKMLAGFLPTINLKHDATVADLADAVLSSDPDAYHNCRPVFIRILEDGGSEELEDENRRLSSVGLQSGVEEELVMLVENVEDLVRQSKYRTRGAEAVMLLLQRGGRYVKKLELDYTTLGDSLCSAMAPAWSSLTSITHLDLSDNYIGDTGIRIIASGLANMKSLTHLDLSCNKFGDCGFRDVASALKELKLLAHLDLSQNQIGDTCCLSLALALESLQALKQLNLSNNKFSDAGVSALISAMTPLVNLASLNVLGTGFDTKACEVLTVVLPQLVSLKFLNLGFCRVGFSELTQNMITHESLTQVEINARRLNTDDVHTLAASLMNLTTLHALSLYFVEMNDDRCRALAPAFATLKALKQLTLDGVNNNGGAGNRELANILATLESLEYLKLSDNQMLDFAVLAPSMSKMTSLHHLDLSYNRIDARGSRALAHFLPEMKFLEYLKLRDNEIDNEGCRALAPALTSLKSLRWLDLTDNQYDIDACFDIIAAVQSLQPLLRLRMRNRVNPLNISKEACRQLAEVLTRMRSWMIGDHGGYNESGCELCKHEFDSNNQQQCSSESPA